MSKFILALGLAALAMQAVTAHAATTGTCTIYAGRSADKIYFAMDSSESTSDRHHHENSSDMLLNRWTGVTLADLGREGAELDARMHGDAGEIRCIGKVHDSELHGTYTFTPDEQFAQRMQSMGFTNLDADRLQGYVMLDITIAWVKGMQDLHVAGMNSENLMGLRALKVDPAYVRDMTAAGYPELHADKLTAMRAVGVSPEKVQAVRAMGLKPSQDELIQMSVFKIDAPFVQRMKARGLKDLTIAQLVQIKVFKLDE